MVPEGNVVATKSVVEVLSGGMVILVVDVEFVVPGV
jgi:hypothetical protein